MHAYFLMFSLACYCPCRCVTIFPEPVGLGLVCFVFLRVFLSRVIELVLCLCRLLFGSCLVVSTSNLERPVSEITYYVSSGTLKSTHSTHSLTLDDGVGTVVAKSSRW